MLGDDIDFVDLELKEVPFSIDFVQAWQRIKAALVEPTNSSHNKQMEKCFRCASCIPTCEHNALFGSKYCSTIAKFKA
jgi:succinate dehydrogenase/fumarate reductase-like Fe-S protein